MYTYGKLALELIYSTLKLETISLYIHNRSTLSSVLSGSDFDEDLLGATILFEKRTDLVDFGGWFIRFKYRPLGEME